MNLDAFKNELKERLEEEAQQASKSQSDHAQMLRKRTNSLLARLIRSLQIELFFAIVLGLAGIVVTITTPTALSRITGIGIFIICLIIGLYCIPIYRKLHSLLRENADLRNMLNESIAVTSRFLTFYIWYTIAMVPVGAVLGFISGADDSDDTNLLEALHLDVEPTLAAIVFLVVFAGLMGWFAWWYITKMYSRHLKALRQCLVELDEQAETD